MITPKHISQFHDTQPYLATRNRVVTLQELTFVFISQGFWMANTVTMIEIKMLAWSQIPDTMDEFLIHF